MTVFVAVTEDGMVSLVHEMNFSRSIAHSVYAGDGPVLQYAKVWALTEDNHMVEVRPRVQNSYPVEDDEGIVTHHVKYYWMADSKNRFFGEPFTVSVNLLV